MSDRAERIATALERIATAMEKMEAAPDTINVLHQAQGPWSGLWDMMQAMNPMAPRRAQ